MFKSLNFEHLKDINPELGKTGQNAEKHIFEGRSNKERERYRDAMKTLRSFAEILTQTIAKQNNIDWQKQNYEGKMVSKDLSDLYQLKNLIIDPHLDPL